MYPVCVCAIEQNREGVCFLRKTGETERKEVPRALARFLARLDGKTDPLALVPGIPKEEMDRYLSELEGMDYITTRRWNGSLLMAQITLWFAPRRVPAAVRRACRALSLLLAVLWLPVLSLGLMQLLRGNWADGGSDTLGIVLGLLAGIILHEAGHAVTCVGFGGRLVCVGVCVQLLLIPGAFVMPDYIHLPRAARVHMLLSGVEMNFLLAGLAFLAGVVVWGDCFAMLGVVNVTLALLNLGVYYSALEELLGDLDLSEAILTRRSARRTIRRRAGVSGRARIAAVHILFAMQLGILSILILNFKEVLSWIFLLKNSRRGCICFCLRRSPLQGHCFAAGRCLRSQQSACSCSPGRSRSATVVKASGFFSRCCCLPARSMFF